MKLRHFAMVFATLFLPACSNETNTTDNVSRLQNIQLNEPSLISPTPYNTPKSNATTGVINDQDEVQRIENEFNKSISQPSEENTSEELDQPTLLSTFSTKVYTKTNARMNNLNIVCNKISGVIIRPGEEFSYNDVAGPYDKEHGFGKATVLLGDGSEVQGYGGGVCQVSSTLYNAVKDCGVEITERHNHSKDVHYVPKNQDATVSYGNLDFKFKNLNDYPIQIQASANKQNVTVEIYKA